MRPEVESKFVIILLNAIWAFSESPEDPSDKEILDTIKVPSE